MQFSAIFVLAMAAFASAASSAKTSSSMSSTGSMTSTGTAKASATSKSKGAATAATGLPILAAGGAIGVAVLGLVV
ncbi:uncharacterized protein RCC_04486 [Ramularia collo-cygni]|uniref:Uncharacterized protein n=1 Tax=Ramularia collo-cygni TaxID=112498 RepID=A0A2D3UPT2_9PEZI|nr:uncharacterized protein RCC_04486 [Ramularia collo-cygni]CZT18642.1 uncharacterized protein RCC_04486 [Ramularia collo-cygni]